MRNSIKVIFIILVAIMFFIAFSASYSSLNMDNLAYVTAIGIDTANINNMEVTFQFSIVAPSSKSGTSSKTPTAVNSVIASSLSNAINLMNNYVGKEINLSHCKVIIFSEDFAYKGLEKEIYSLINNVQIRSSANIIISKCGAKDYIQNTEPFLENSLLQYYDLFANSTQYTGYSVNSTVGEFFDNLVSRTSEAYAILGGINTKELSTASSINSQKDSSMKANETTIITGVGTQNVGVAVFKDDKLVGELNAIETLSFLALTDDLKRFLISVPDPEAPDSYLDIYLTPKHVTDVQVDISSGSPYIKINMKLSGRIYSMTSNKSYENSSYLKSISNSCNSYLESTFSNYLYKTSKEFKSDINKFGLKSLSQFLTSKDFEEYNWLENYKNAFFDVNVETSVKSGYILIDT